MKISRFVWLLLPLMLLAMDVASKAIVTLTIPLHATRVVIPRFFNLTVNYNHGAIFGVMSGASTLLRTLVFGITGVITLIYFGWEFLQSELPTMQRIALGLVLGGGLGNSIDRMQHGFVVDFLDFVFCGWHYWTFNFADSFILCGTTLLLVCLPCINKGSTD